MAYDEELADRVREALGGVADVTEKRMFGGLALLVGGNMAIAVGDGGLLVRIDPADQTTLTLEPGAQEAVMGGRRMTGWLDVAEEAVAEDADLAAWVQRGVTRATSLPPK